MVTGFFEPRAPAGPTKYHGSLIPKCGACGLLHKCKTPKMPVYGDGRLGVLLVLESPSSDQDVHGGFVNNVAVRFLKSVLADIGVDLKRDCWVTHALICTTHGREPKEQEIGYCRPNLVQLLDDLDPNVLVPMGKAAIRSVLEPYWREQMGKEKNWHGWQIPLQALNRWVVPTPSANDIAELQDKSEGQAARVWLTEYLQRAFIVEGKPWSAVPDFTDQVDVVMDPVVAAGCLREFEVAGKAVAFDYETNRLKPDGPYAEIVTCAVSDGKQTIAYPWTGAAVQATGSLLRSSVSKLGANNKFEDRWTLAEFGYKVVNWAWDTMLSAHHLDNRGGITSVKFQAMVRLGFSPWDFHIKPYLKASDANGCNRIKDLDMRTLLIYNGVDALIEYKLAGLQKKEMFDGQWED